MADQVQGAPGKAKGAAGGVQGVTSGILSSIGGFGNWVAAKGKAVLDRVFPPEQRASVLSKLQSFMLANPKISAFLGMNFAITGVPLFLFVLFTLTVFLFSLIVGLLLGLLGAVVFTLGAVGFALLFVLPTIFFTTMTACFLFLWGLGGYYLLRWANGEDGDKPAPEGQGLGDKLNNLTGGRLTGFMGAARDERAKGDISGYNDEHTKPKHDAPKQQQQHHQANGTADKEAPTSQKKEQSAPAKATKASGAEHSPAPASNVKATAKSATNGVTGD